MDTMVLAVNIVLASSAYKILGISFIIIQIIDKSGPGLGWIPGVRYM